jgi:general secretion pathway protein A
MEYFKALNLAREPFSNSPEPDFFFHSPKHIRCLQKLELAIRLRRGLNVVLGHVGTGKTTLCRHMIGQFAETDDAAADAVETHLLLDPAFTTPLEFLSAVARSFGILGKRKRKSASAETHPLMDPELGAPLDIPPTEFISSIPAAKQSRRAVPDPGLTDWQIKESIKDYLFKKGVDENRTVLLIIDEGQKLPDFCLEILREFLNFETNENKLLQIVIFGQPEFQQILDRLENFADRVNLLYILEPLNFKETRDMIRYRLTQAGEPGYTPTLFTLPGLLAVYLATEGYPRKIITLCHQVILAIIIQNRARAGWFLVRSCAARLATAGRAWRVGSLRWVTGVLIASAAVILFFTFRPATTGSVKTPDPPRQETMRENTAIQNKVQKDPGVTQIDPTSTTDPQVNPKAVAAEDSVRYQKPDMLGKLVLKNGRTIWWMLTDFYGEYDPGILRSVASANPHIRSLSRVQAGEVIHLPALPAGKSPLAANRYWVQILSSNNLEETYEFFRTYKPELSSLRFLPYWNPRQGVIFSVVLKDGFPDEITARQKIAALPAVLASRADVIKNPDKDTVFYTR